MNITSLDPERFTLDLIGDAERGYDLLMDRNITALKNLVPEHHVLSIYLDTRPERLKDEPAMLRFRHAVDAIRQAQMESWTHADRALFDAVVDDISEQLEALLNKPHGRGIALFAAPARVLPKKGKVNYTLLLRFSLPEGPTDLVEWSDTPALTPLLVLRDEHPETGIVLFDREHVRFFLYHMGEAAEYTINLINPERPPLTRAHVWHGYGEHNHHQWQQEHYRRYLHHAALAVSKIAAKAEWKWLVLASPDALEAKHLEEQLPPALAQRVIGVTPLPMQANRNEVRDHVQPLIAAAEKAEEARTLEQWRGELEKPDGKAVSGIADTVLAATEYRLLTLVVEEGFIHRGWRCNDCGGLIADLAEQPPASCPYCSGESFTEHADIVGEVAVNVITSGGEVEIVHDPENRAQAHELGMVGGLLRY